MMELFWKNLWEMICRVRISDVSRWFLYAFFAFLPFQVNALVSTPDVFETGFFNPYMSHFLYLSDICLLIGLFLFGVSVMLGQNGFSNGVRIGDKWLFGLILGFVGMYGVSFLMGGDFLYFIRMIEGLIIYLLLVNDLVHVKNVAYVLIGTVSVSAFIGIFQYVAQGSIGLGFLGEPVVSAEMSGVAKVALGDLSVLRAYSTFPHPNVFAGYLLFGIFLCIWRFRDARVLTGMLLAVMGLALVLTFSRAAFLGLATGLMVYYAVSGICVKWKYLVLALVLVMFFIVAFDLGSVVSQRFLIGDENAFSERMLFLSISKSMFFDNFLGVGAGNFTVFMQDYTNLKLMPWLIQPVHNIFLLTLNELGVQGLIVFLGMIGYLFVLLMGKKSRFSYILLSLLAVIGVIGMFDHYFLSLYQGQMLLWGYFGLLRS